MEDVRKRRKAAGRNATYVSKFQKHKAELLANVFHKEQKIP